MSDTRINNMGDTRIHNTSTDKRVNYRTPRLRITVALTEGKPDGNPPAIWVKGGTGLKLNELIEAVSFLTDQVNKHNDSVK